MKLLLEPNSDSAGAQKITTESTGSNITSEGVVAPAPVQNIQAEAFKGSPSTPVQKEAAIPENIKKMKFDIAGEDISGGEAEEASPEFNVEAKKKEESKVELSGDAKTKLENDKKLNTKIWDKKKEETAPPTKEQLETLAKDKEKGKLPARDFSVFPDEVKDVLKDTSRAAFEYITKTVQELKTIKEEKEKSDAQLKQINENGVPATWYEHPEAWRLHPASQQSLGRIERLDAEEHFWRQQLENINAGKPYRTLKGWNTKTGEMVVGEEVEPSEQAKTDIFLSLGRYQQEKHQEAVRLNTFAQSFQGRIQQFNKGIEDIIEKEFPWHKDATHEGQKWVKEFQEVLPDDLRGQTGFRIASLLYATYMKTEELRAELEEKLKNTETIKQSTQLAEPTLRSPSIGGESKKVANGNGRYTPPATFDLAGM